MCCSMTQNLMDKEYRCQKYKRFVSNIFFAENIFMDNKYIFVPCERRFDVNIFWKGIFDANILSLKEKKKSLQCDIRSKFTS